MNTDMPQWLANLKAGDFVLLKDAYDGTDLVEVERVTATQVVTEHSRWNRTTGRRCGESSGFRTPYILDATPERVEQLRAAKRRQFVMRYQKWSTAPQALIDQIHALLMEQKP